MNTPSFAKKTRYHVVEKLGEGGAAQVFLAVSCGTDQLRRPVVLKVPKKAVLQTESDARSFIEEAELCARLSHENIVQVYEVIQHDDVPVMVMQYLEGQTLYALRKQSEPQLGVDQHLLVLHDALLGLHYAHEFEDYDGSRLNLIHRDISPQNIFVTQSGQIKVLDFGIAKTRVSVEETAAGVLKGKVKYMSPEQVRQERMDKRSDVFAVGVLFYEALHRRRMWSGQGDLTVIARLMEGRIPSEAPAGTPDALRSILSKALAAEASERYQSAQEMARDLEAYCPSLTATANRRALGHAVLEGTEQERTKRRFRIKQALDTSDDTGPRISLPTGVSLDTNTGHSGTQPTLRPGASARPHPFSIVPPQAGVKKLIGPAIFVFGSLAAGVAALVWVTSHTKKSHEQVSAEAPPSPPAAQARQPTQPSQTAQTREPAQAKSASRPTGSAPKDDEISSKEIATSPRQPPTSCPGPAGKGTGKEPMIDDFNRVNKTVYEVEGRSGRWYSYHDGSALAPSARIVQDGMEVALRISGGPWSTWGGGIGADIYNECPYDVSYYKGVRLIVRGTSPFIIKVVTPRNYGPPLGTCTAPEPECADSHMKRITPTSEWQIVDVTWEDLKQRGFAQKIEFDPREVSHVQLEFEPGIEADLWVDSLSFFR